MEEDEYEKLVFQADFENDGERLYQFYISEYKAVLDGDRFALDCLRNERLSPKIRGFFVGGFRGKVYKYLLKFIIFLNTSVIFENEINILWYIDKYTVYTFVIIRYISNLEDIWYNIPIIKRK